MSGGLESLTDDQLRELQAAGGDLSKVSDATLKALSAVQPRKVGGRGTGVDAIDWAGTRVVNAGAGVAGIPAATGGFGDWARSQLQAPGRWLRGLVGSTPDAGPHAAPAMPTKQGQVGAGAPVAPPTSREITTGIMDATGMREVNLPGRIGRAIDTGVEGAISAVPFGWAAIIPGAAGGVGSEALGQVAEGTPWEVPARVAGGILGGGAGALGQAGVKYAWQAGRSAVDPFLSGGRERVVGRALNEAASDPATATARMQASAPTIPGSRPTAAQAANDPGLLALENNLKGRVGDQFAMRTAESNAARMTAADRISPAITAEQAGDTLRGAMQIRKSALEGARKKVTGPMYTAADLMDPAINGRPILDFINNGIMRETGPIRDALKTARDSLYIGEGQGRRIASSVGEWQAVKRALDEQIGAAKAGSPLERQLKLVWNEVDGALKAGPMFNMADKTYSAMSTPLRPYSQDYAPRVAAALETGPYHGPYIQPSETIPRAFLKRGTTGVDEALAAAGGGQSVKQAFVGRLMDDFKSAIRTTTDDPLNNKVLSAAAADRWWQANKDVAAKVMTPAQVKGMQTLVDDFAMGARRPQGVAGSNTAQNLASGNMLNAVLRFRALAGSSAMQTTMGRALSWIYSIPEQQLQEVLLNAMMDPKVASALMVKASPGNAKLLAPLLERAVAPVAIGAGQSDRSRR